MNPVYGALLWAAIGVATGWAASWLIGIRTWQGGGLYAGAGVGGGVLGGLIDRTLFRGQSGEGGLFATFGGPVIGATVAVLVLKLLVGGRQLVN